MSRTIKAHPPIVVALAARGHSQATIASMLGVSRERIRQICDRDGITTLRGHRQLDAFEMAQKIVATGERMTVDELSERVRSTSVRKWIEDGKLARPAEPPKHWNDLRKFAERGWTVIETAKYMGVKPRDILTRSKSIGVTFATRHD